MNNSKLLFSLARVYQRQATRSASAEAVAKKTARLKELQKHFTLENGVPVYKKGGFSDKALMGVTTALIAVGVGLSAETCWKLTFKDA